MMRKLLIPAALSCLMLTGCGAAVTKISGIVEDTSRRLFPRHEADSSDPKATDMKQMEEIVAEAHEKFASEVKSVWGEEDMALPSRKVWVQYDDHMMTRTFMDFERGELRVEHLMQPGESEQHAHRVVEHAAHQAVQESPADLARHDEEMRIVHELAEQRGLQMSAQKSPPPDSDTPILEGLIDDEAMARLDQQEMQMAPVTSGDGVVRTKLSVRIPFKADFYARLAARYEDSVIRFARGHGLQPSLILAVIQTESAFNPRAVSPIPAYGLMQLVPSSGGLDAYHFVYGEKRLVGPDYLFQPDNNIELGAAYLNLLYTRYLRSIDDPLSRLYCTIAAYNTGAGNVARAFSDTTNIRKAADLINRMTPEQVFERLKTKLPYEETRRYVIKVDAARAGYAEWDS